MKLVTLALAATVALAMSAGAVAAHPRHHVRHHAVHRGPVHRGPVHRRHGMHHRPVVVHHHHHHHMQ